MNIALRFLPAGLLLVGAGIAAADGFTLSSPTLGGQMSESETYNGFGCNGKNTSPALQWRNAPSGTRSFAVTVFDPAAPTGSGWWHWIIYGISADVHSLAADAGNPAADRSPPGSKQSTTDFGTPGYGGGCPPVGDAPHPYIFTVYALGVEKLGVPAQATPAMIAFNLNANALAKASIVSYLKR